MSLPSLTYIYITQYFHATHPLWALVFFLCIKYFFVTIIAHGVITSIRNIWWCYHTINFLSIIDSINVWIYIGYYQVIFFIFYLWEFTKSYIRALFWKVKYIFFLSRKFSREKEYIKIEIISCNFFSKCEETKCTY